MNKQPKLLKLALIAAAFPALCFVQAQTSEPYTFTTFAGTPSGSMNGVGASARFNTPSGIAVDSAGNSYVADTNNHTIRKITPTGEVTTFAGSVGKAGNADGSGSAARFNSPYGVAVDSADNIFVTDSNNNAIRKITPTGDVTTVVTGLSVPKAVAVDNAGNLYVAMFGGVRKIASGDVRTSVGSGFFSVAGIAVDSAGNVYVGDSFNNRITKVAPDGTMMTLAGGGPGSADGTGTAARFRLGTIGGGLAIDSSGNVYVADTNNATIRKITPSGDVTTLAGLAGSSDGGLTGSSGSTDGTGSAARFFNPQALAVDTNGNLYVADTGNNAIRKITPLGLVATLAGRSSYGSEDGAAAVARFNNAFGVTADSTGNLYVADQTAVRKITPAGAVSTLAGLGGVSGSLEGTGSSARFVGANCITVDGDGNVYVGETLNHTIRKITPTGVVTTLAGLAGNPGSADGVGSAARFNQPIGIVADSAGNVYVADLNNNTIRKVTSDGTVSTLAGLAGFGNFGPSVDGTGSDARFSGPAAIAINNAGDLYVAERFSGKIRKVTSAGVVTTPINTSPGGFFQAVGIGVDGLGNIYGADLFSRTVRRLTPTGDVVILAGAAGFQNYIDGTGNAARFANLSSIALDSSGKLYVTDKDCVRTGNLLPAISTPLGNSIAVDAGTVDLNFSQITQPGTTTVAPLNPDYAGALPSGYELAGSGLAFEISTTALYQGPILISFQVSVDPATFSQLRVLHNENGTLVDRTASTPAPNPMTQTIYASVDSLSPFVIAKLPPTQTFAATIQPPINADGTSVFNVKRGGVPVKFTLADGGTATCALPSATISLTRTAGGTTQGPINESVYSIAADSGSNFRIDDCQYIYNLAASALGTGTYRVDIKINNQVVGSGSFQLK